uniref:RING-type domain-containing protein n=1 Tax=Oryza glumipatula TaxID=40148 RepID=A0A0D9Z0Y3_9ORYZ
MEEGHGLRRHKRRRLVGQQAATTQLVEEVDDQQQQQQEEEAAAPTCSICLQPWTCNGDHRIPPFHNLHSLWTCLRQIVPGEVAGTCSSTRHWTSKATNQLVTILSMQCPQCGEEFEPHRITNLYAPGINIRDGCCKNHANEVGEYYNREYEGLKTQMESTIAKQGKDLEELDVLVKSVGRQFESLESSLKSFLLSMTERMKMMATQLPAAMDLVQYLEKDVHDIISALSQKPP